MKILYPDSISGYPDIRILYPDIRILYPKLVCFGYHFLENFPFSLHYCYVKITIFHPVVSKIKLRFYLKPGNREPMFECWDESGSEHPDMVPHRGVWSKENTHRILWRQYFSMLLCTGSEHHSANLSQFLLAQRCVPPDCGVGDYPHVFLNQVIRDLCLGESCD